jgi:hypothetical protein
VTATPPDPRQRRQEVLAQSLRVASALAFVLAVLGTAPGDAGRLGRGAMLAVVMCAPLLRTAWLGVRWWRRGDGRHAAVSAVVLGIVGAGALVAGV